MADFQEYPNAQFYSNYRAAASSHPSMRSVLALWGSMKNNIFPRRNLENQRPNLLSIWIDWSGTTEARLKRKFEAWLY